MKNKENKLAIINMSEIKPSRHPLLNLSKNPYLMEDQTYYDKRRIVKSEAKFREAVYRKHSHKCPVCDVSLHNGEPVELHHILPVKEGGKYTLENIQPLHQICHQSITHNKMNKPAHKPKSNQKLISQG
jgi:RNA-directed DNA polymerase